MSSSTCCSLGWSTSRSVDATCCASTARHSLTLATVDLVATARGVQVMDDINQTFGFGNQLPRRAAECRVFAVQPRFGLIILGADQRVEGAEQAHEECGQFPGFLPVGQRVFACG